MKEQSEKHQLTRQEAMDCLHASGAPRDMVRAQSHSTVLDYIARASMRDLSDPAISLNQKIKTQLKKFFEHKSLEEIEWVLSHGLESRGFFRKLADHNTAANQTLKDDLMHWLDTPHEPQFNSLDISLINGVISAISYAAFDRDTTYKGVDLTDVKAQCASLMAPAPFVGTYLSERMNAIMRKHSGSGELRLTQQDSLNEAYKQQNIVAAKKRMVSFASTSGDFPYMTDLPDLEATRRVFQLSEDKKFTITAAEKGRLVGHFSANTTSALFVINELLKIDNPENSSEIVLSVKEAQLIAGMIAADYHRSAFHSPEEVFLGMLPYLEKVRLAASQNEPVSKDALIAHLATEIPKHLPQNSHDFTQLTQNAILLMASVTEEYTQRCIAFLAQEVAQHPDMEIEPESMPLFIAEQKENTPFLFQAIREKNTEDHNLSMIPEETHPPMIIEPMAKDTKSALKVLGRYFSKK